MDCAMEDLDSCSAVPSDTEIIVEGHREALRERLKQQTTCQRTCIVKRSQQKSKAVEDGVQLRLSGPPDVIEKIRSNDTVSSAVGASFGGCHRFLGGAVVASSFPMLGGLHLQHAGRT